MASGDVLITLELHGAHCRNTAFWWAIICGVWMLPDALVVTRPLLAQVFDRVMLL